MNEEKPTMRLAMSDNEAQTVIDALIDYIHHSNPSANGKAVAWNVISEMAITSYRLRKEKENGGNDHTQGPCQLLQQRDQQKAAA